MQKQLILLDREVDEYENLHLLLKSCRARCEHLERQIDKYEEIKERNKPRRKIFRKRTARWFFTKKNISERILALPNMRLCS